MITTSVYRDLRAAAEGAGLTTDATPELRALRSLAVVDGVAERDACSPDVAAVAVVAQGVSLLVGTEGRSRLGRRQIAEAALALGPMEGVQGLHRRLKAVAAGRVQLSTMRNHWAEVSQRLAAMLEALDVDQVPLVHVADTHQEADARFVGTLTDVLYTLEGRRLLRCDVVRELVARTEDLRAFEFVFSYPLDPRPNVLKPESAFNCEIASTRFRGDGKQLTVLNLPRTRPGESVRFGYSMIVETVVADAPYFRHLGRWPSTSLRVGVQFELRQFPTEMWSFHGLDMSIDPTIKQPQFPAVRISPLGYARADFAREVIGRGSGVGWSW